MPSQTLYMPPRHYLNENYGVTSWLLTRDHKRIGLLYLASGRAGVASLGAGPEVVCRAVGSTGVSVWSDLTYSISSRSPSSLTSP